MTAVVLTVYGTPAPKGSMRSLGKGVMVDSNAHVAPWRSMIAQAVLAQPVRDLDGPLSVELTVTVRRPGRASKAKDQPITRASGDVDKHVRCVLDALQDAALIVDDSRVISVRALKTYPGESLDALDQPGAVICVRQVQ